MIFIDKDKKGIKMEKQNEETQELTVEENLKAAFYNMFIAANYFTQAGFDSTSEKIMDFVSTGVARMEEEENKLELEKNKLSNDEYDDILNDILGVEIKAPNHE